MTLFFDFRSSAVAGSVLSIPRIYDATVVGETLSPRTVHKSAPSDRIVGRHVVLATHGFNVSGESGLRSLARLEQTLALGPGFLFIGVLWPGDWYVPIINYPAEGKDAALCGDHLAAAAAAQLGGAEKISFLSHSLGGRLILQAVKKLKGEAGQVCLTAPAVDDRCLAAGKAYETVRGKSARVTVLSSSKDEALGVVYSAGSLGGRLLGDGQPFGAALGLRGPRTPIPDRVVSTPIPSDQTHGHGDYFPPSKPAELNQRADRSIQVMASALRGESVVWPHKGWIPRDPGQA